MFGDIQNRCLCRSEAAVFRNEGTDLYEGAQTKLANQKVIRAAFSFFILNLCKYTNLTTKLLLNHAGVKHV